MSKATRNWDVALSDLRDMAGEDADPAVDVLLGSTSADRIREWARRFALAAVRVTNCAEMWAREEAREAKKANR